MPDKSADEKMLEALESLLPKLEGIQRESAEHRIKCLNEKLKKNQHNKKIFSNDIVTKHEFEQKINLEKNLISGYEKIMSVDTAQVPLLKHKKRFSENKLALLNSLMKQIESKTQDSEQVVSKRISGNVNFLISDINFDPLFKCLRLDFYVDSILKDSINVQNINKKEDIKLQFILENNHDFEIIFVGEVSSLLGIIFFSCEYFLNYIKPRKDEFAYLQNASFKAEIKFEKEVKILRKNAEIICIYKEGHALETLGIISPVICAVCDQIATFSSMYRCMKCKITCHKRCANYILFYCSLAKELQKEGAVKRYAIPHKFENENASGIRYCGQCGIRIKLGLECKKCMTCNTRFHSSCAMYAPKSCGISYELRKKMADFNPPLPEKPKKDQKFSLLDFKLMKVLGRGAFGKVMLANREKDTIAIKIMKKEMVVNNNNIEYLELERSILQRVSEARHPFLMRMLYCFQDNSNVYFGTEFLAGGDLFHYASNFSFTHSQILLYSCEIILGLEYLHSQNIIYRDMKLDNVLICADGHIKIADFGICKDKIKWNEKTNTFCGTADTLAPEVILQGGYTKDVDWWSFGVVMFEMFQNELPFNGSTTEEITAEILKNEPEFSKSTPPIPKDLIKKLLQKDPLKRIGYGKEDGKAIRKHEYFKNINWNDVLEKKIKPEFIPNKNISDNFDDEFVEEPILVTPCSSFIEYDKYFINFHQ